MRQDSRLEYKNSNACTWCVLLQPVISSLTLTVRLVFQKWLFWLPARTPALLNRGVSWFSSVPLNYLLPSYSVTPYTKKKCGNDLRADRRFNGVFIDTLFTNTFSLANCNMIFLTIYQLWLHCFNFTNLFGFTLPDAFRCFFAHHLQGHLLVYHFPWLFWTSSTSLASCLPGCFVVVAIFLSYLHY
jgi:hypothetical protein